MSDVNRYTFDPDAYSSCDCSIERSKQGEYRLNSDYEALEAKVKELEEEISKRDNTAIDYKALFEATQAELNFNAQHSYEQDRENQRYRAALNEIEKKGHGDYHGKGYSLADIAREALNPTEDKTSTLVCIDPTDKGADSLLKYWEDNAEALKHSYNESTWEAINAAMEVAGLPSKEDKTDG